MHNSELTERKRIMEIASWRNSLTRSILFSMLETLREILLLMRAKASDMVMAFANLMRYSIYCHYGS